MALDLELIRLYSRSLDYYREKAETARWRVWISGGADGTVAGSSAK